MNSFIEKRIAIDKSTSILSNQVWILFVSGWVNTNTWCTRGLILAVCGCYPVTTLAAYPGLGNIGYGNPSSGYSVQGSPRMTITIDKAGTHIALINKQGQMVYALAPQSYGRVTALTYNNRGQVSGMASYRLSSSSGERCGVCDHLDTLLRNAKKDSRSAQYYRQLGEFKAILDQHANLREYNIGYQFDNKNRITHVTLAEGDIRFVYNDKRYQVERTLPNGIRSLFTFSNKGMLRRIEHKKNSQLIADYRYRYNKEKRLSKEIIRAGNSAAKAVVYRWTQQGELRSIRRQMQKTVRIERETNGRIRDIRQADNHQIYRFDKTGRLASVGKEILHRNKNGNIARITAPGNQIKIDYDTNHYPATITDKNNTIGLSWDTFGKLISKHDANRDKIYFIQHPLSGLFNDMPIMAIDDKKRLMTSYIYAGGLLAQRNSKGQTHYYLEDGRGAVRYVVNNKGVVVTELRYTPFGDIQNIKGLAVPDFPFTGIRHISVGNVYVGNGVLHRPRIGTLNSAAVLNNPIFSRNDNRYTRQAWKLINNNINNIPQLSEEEMADLDRYWTEGAYRNDPYYQNIESINPPLEFASAIFTAISIQRPIVAVGLSMVGAGTLGVIAGAGYYALSKKFLRIMKDKGASVEQLEKAVFTHDVISKSLNIYGWYNTGIKYTNLPTRLNIVNTSTYQKWKHVTDWQKVTGNLKKDMAHYYLNKKLTNIADQVTELKGYQFQRSLNSIQSTELKIAGQSNKEKRRFGKLGRIDGDVLPSLSGGGGDPPEPPGGGHESNGVFNLGSGFDPFSFFNKAIGGIRLDSNPILDDSLTGLLGAVFDPSKNILVLLGNNEIGTPKINLQDLAIALYSVYFSQTPIEFSLDPFDRNNPSGSWLKAIYRPHDLLAGSEFGRTLFEADYLLKQYAFGIELDKNNKIVERHSSVDQYISTVDILFNNSTRSDGKSRWTRYWITPKKMVLRKGKNGIYFEKASMQVMAMRQVPDPSTPTGLRDIQVKDPISAEFTRRFTAAYDSISQESKSFGRVKELAKAVAWAKWMYAEGIKIDESWVISMINKRDKYVNRVPTLSVSYSRTHRKPITEGTRQGILTSIEKIHVSGGVDLSVNPKYKRSNQKLATLTNQVHRQINNANSPVFFVNDGTHTYKAVVLPQITGATVKESNPFVVERPGARFTFNKDKKLIGQTNKTGEKVQYHYNKAGILNKVEIQTNKLGEIIGTKLKKGSRWDIQKDGQVVSYVYNNHGDIERKLLNGIIKYQICFDRRKNTINVFQDGLSQYLRVDPKIKYFEFDMKNNTAVLDCST